MDRKKKLIRNGIHLIQFECYIILFHCYLNNTNPLYRDYTFRILFKIFFNIMLILFLTMYTLYNIIICLNKHFNLLYITRNHILFLFFCSFLDIPRKVIFIDLKIYNGYRIDSWKGMIKRHKSVSIIICIWWNNTI